MLSHRLFCDFYFFLMLTYCLRHKVFLQHRYYAPNMVGKDLEFMKTKQLLSIIFCNYFYCFSQINLLFNSAPPYYQCVLCFLR
jgi:hypothetical protein